MMRLRFFSQITLLLAAGSFSAQAQTPPNYAVTDLGVLSGESNSFAYAINSLGHVTGVSGNRPFLYTPEAGMVEIPRLPQVMSSYRCAGVSINRQDSVVVNCAFLGDQGSGDTGVSYVYSPGVALTLLPGASAINDSGQVAGSSKDGNGKYRAYLYTPAAGYQYIIKSGFEVLGSSLNSYGSVTGSLLQSGVPAGAFIYSLQTGLRLVSLPATDGYATAINDAGQVAGTFTRTSDGLKEGFHYRPGGSLVDLGRIDAVQAINSNDDIVGRLASKAVLYQSNLTGTVDLNTLIAANSGWVLESANGINDNGQIAGYGTINGQEHAFLLSLPVTCAFTVSPSPLSLSAAGGSGTLTIAVASGCPYTATSDSSWLAITPPSGTGNGTLTYIAAPNLSQIARTAQVTIGTATLLVTQAPATACSFSIAPLGFTFSAAGGQGAAAVTTNSSCAFTASSNAAWILVDGATRTGSGSVTLTVAANPGPARSGTVTIGGQTVVVVQTAANQTAGTRFIPVTPCRVADTRAGSGKTGPFGAPFLAPSTGRDIPIPASSCGIPGTARAYSLNVTAVPYEGLSYLTVWPTGQPFPQVSTLNSFDGSVVANAAVVPAGAGGSVSVLASNLTDVIVDINGYFVSSDTPQALAFYPLTPCRMVDTRPGQGTTGAFGPPSLPSGYASRTFPLRASTCAVPASAQAYSLNFTAVPSGKLAFLTVGPSGQPQPQVSTLNSFNGKVVANAAIVPSGPDGSIDVYSLLDSGASSDLIIDIDGYFAPPGAPGALSFYPVAPCRAVDTRLAAGPLGGPALPSGGNQRDFPLQQSVGCGLSPAAQAYSLNLTVVPTGKLSYLTAWPTGGPQPLVSTLNSFDGRIVANAALVPAGTNGSISIFTSIDPGKAADLIVDVNGYFAP